jgi:hypothetical protein
MGIQIAAVIVVVLLVMSLLARRSVPGTRPDHAKSAVTADCAQLLKRAEDPKLALEARVRYAERALGMVSALRQLCTCDEVIELSNRCTRVKAEFR